MGIWTLSVSKGSSYIFVLLPRYHHQEFNSIVLDTGVGDKRLLCKRCYGEAVEREQAKVRPLPAVIDPSRMKHVTASIGKCSLCGAEGAMWKGDGSRLYDACYQREVRRGLEAGKSATVSIG